ncbi:MAG: hypothetical protein H7A55_17875 [Verrucomicrobiaceae bacterium]|nr:hypothetical protein [Verrucomicrobiaceae bacterium]
MVTRRFKAGCLITLLVFVSIVVGFFLGIAVAKGIAKKKEDPTFWNEAAIKQLEKLHPTDIQRERFKTLVGGAVDELTVVRNETITSVQTILMRVLADLDKELTPEQHEQFEKMKPKAADMSLDLLKKTRKKD